MARKKTEKSANQELLERIRTRYKAMVEADRENRRDALSDLKFCNVKGEQWDSAQKIDRGENRCLEFNKVRPTVKRVVNEMRKNRPQGKVRAVEDGDKDTADVLEGLIRNIWNVSDADTVIDYAGEYQVGGGYGAWRVNTRYSSDDAFEQDIVIEAIRNPFCLFADNACADILKRDARDWTLTEKISKEAYQSKYKDAEVIEFEADNEFDDDDDWEDEDSVRICEYWYKEPVTRTLCLLSDGSTIDKAEGQVPEGMTVLRERVVQAHKIMMCIASGDAILEGPREWAGKEFPFVVIYGDWLVIDGKVYWSGITRHAKDAQRVYNTANVAAMEFAALQPKAKYWATAQQALGNQDQWAEANVKNLPALVYTPDPLAPGPPTMMNPPPVPAAFVDMILRASEDIKAVTGIYDASLGAQGNETSGRAISARQAQGEVATFNFNDNMAKGIRRTYEILIDLVGKVYDTERAVRVLGIDGAEKYERINQIVGIDQDGRPVVKNDLSRGKYDVVVTVGPSYSTQRQESAETFMELARAYPPLMQVAGDLIFKSMDVPLADKFAERLKLTLPPEIQKAVDGNQSPEVAQAMAQVDQAMQQVQQHGQLVQAAEQQLKELQAQAKNDQASAKLVKAELDAQAREIEIAQSQLDKAAADLEEAKRHALAEIKHAEEKLRLNEQLAELKIQKAHGEAEQSLVQQAQVNDAAKQQNDQAAETNDAQFEELAALKAELKKIAEKPKITRLRRVTGPKGLEYIPEYEQPTPQNAGSSVSGAP